MQRYRIALALFVLFLIEGTILEWLMPPMWQSTVLVAPHPVLVGVVLVALFKSRHQALGYGLAFGFLQDFIYYGHALGVYSFSMGLVGYIIGNVFRVVPRGIVFSLTAASLGSFAYDSLVYAIYRFFLGVVQVDYRWIFFHEILPSLLFNALIALVLYMPARKWLERDDASREQAES